MRRKRPVEDDYALMDEFGLLNPYAPGYQRAVDRDLSRSDPLRSKRSHPYAYDPFTIWGKPAEHKECNGSVYTDRMEQWDYTKYRQLCQKHYRAGESTYFRPFDNHNCRGDLIQAFMRDYFDDPTIRLLRVIEYCNWSTGYPTWRLDYVTTKESK